MVGSDSDSESECFESAEESLDEEEKIERKTRSKKNSRESESEVAKPVVSQNDKVDETLPVEDVSINSLSYRKRPERIKRTPSTPSSKVISERKRSSETVFKTEADVFFQDITNNLSKNINKSLHTLQQTSSNVKDLILSTLPVSSAYEEGGFVYDDSTSTLPASVAEISNVNIDDKTVSSNEHFTESPKTVSIKNNETRNITNVPKNYEEKSLEINPENNVIERDTAQILHSDSSHLENSKINQKNLESKDLGCDIPTKVTCDKNHETFTSEKSESLDDSTHVQFSEALKLNNEKVFDTQENEAKTCQSSVDNSSRNNVNSDKSIIKQVKNTDNPESNFPNKSEFEINNVTTGSQNLKCSDSLMEQECSLNPTIKESNVNLECKNVTLKEEENFKKEGIKTNFDKEEGTVLEKNESLSSSKVNFTKIKEQESLNNSEINAAELGMDLETSEQKETKDVSEIHYNIKEISDGTNEKVSDGWEDFDFSDNEVEDVEPKNVNQCAKLDNSNNAGNSVNKEILTETEDSVENKNDLRFEVQKMSEVVPLKEDLKKEIDKNAEEKSKFVQKKEKETQSTENEKVVEKKELFKVQGSHDEDWNWESWDDEIDDSEEKQEALVQKGAVKNYGGAQNISDNGSKWTGLDMLSQRIDEKQGNWNIGTWGVNLLLNKATAVTQGISNVLEAGLGAPDPETLARIQKEEERQLMEEIKCEEPEEVSKKNSLTGVNLFPMSGITTLVAGVTSKIVEHTKIQEIGSKVLTGGLDTLETFGKKTMEVLQDGDPGLRNKRALLMGNNKPVLSQILREAREKADKEVKEAEEKALAKKCHFETLFDDFQGMVHLEALEMLSRQYELKLQQIKHGMTSDELEELEGVLEEVEQLCALDDLDLNSSVLDFKTSLQIAVEPLKEEISIVKIIQIHDSVYKWLQTTSELDPSLTTLHQKAVSTVAELTAATVHEFHKAGELLSIKECRKTVDEIEALAKLTHILCFEINKICEKFILMAQKKKELDTVNTIVQKVTVIRNNSTSYIQQAFTLLIPVLQAGAAL